MEAGYSHLCCLSPATLEPQWQSHNYNEVHPGLLPSYLHDSLLTSVSQTKRPKYNPQAIKYLNNGVQQQQTARTEQGAFVCFG